MNHHIFKQLTEAFPEISFQESYLLREITFFKIGGEAEVFLATDNRQQLSKIIPFCHQNQIAITFIGGASNVLVSDQGIKGLVIHLTNDQVVIEKGEPLSLLRAGAGLKTALLVRKMVDAELTGLEYFLGVPGTVGGAVYNNAHYMNHLMAEYITRVEVIDPDGHTKWLKKEECDFKYDHSRFQSTQELIFQVEFSLPAGDQETSKELITSSTQYRAQTQPLGQPSSGCIFQNVPNTPDLQAKFPQFAEQDYIGGGFLIDQAGLKGARVGDIVVSDKHAAFFINQGQGSTAQVKELIKIVKNTVKEKFGVNLQEEVFFLGQK